jgi:hypothetical protein
MAKSIRVNPKKRGRPKTTGRGQLIGIRVHKPLLAALDVWIADQESAPSRPEAIRRLVELGLAGPSRSIPLIVATGDEPATAGRARAAKPAAGTKAVPGKKTRQRRS